MVIELEEPFRSKWKKGYLQTCKDGRKRVYLSNSKYVRTTVSYARYLMSVKLGRFLKDDEHVDHIDEDGTNDDIENLQILTPQENNKKNKDTLVAKERVVYKCPACNKVFDVRHGNSHLVNSKKYELKTCSRKCSSSLTKLKLSKEDKFNLSERNRIK